MTHTIYVDAVLFDMDGTLTDSIAAVEAAWGKVAKDIGQDPEYVIAATHGKRAIDNLARFRPDIKDEDMADEVQKFEETILYFADAYNRHGPGSQTGSPWPSATPATPSTPFESAIGTPDLSFTPSSSAPSSRAPSISSSRRPSFGTRLGNMLAMSVMEPQESRYDDPIIEDVVEEMAQQEGKGGLTGAKQTRHELKAWQIEAASVDRSVQILPGVKKLMDSIPHGHYAVATSGAKTYAYGCMTRVGITPPAITITADDKRLKAGKPAPDPFLLAAECLGFDAKKCIVFEDSPSGIKAGVASGATVIAVCTSHERKKIENCGAHFIVENMEKVKCSPIEVDGKISLRFDIEA
ncbi:HAD-like protein [Vararia minispora EC-137]|uniref:HAD-like protein n=1 Tax=Vararia minispora EC-137 TaxID=1314806 RepID=A0ACB8QJT5_9AGAM|nr:HAD-like protein [Vararia minispora EC-137]